MTVSPDALHLLFEWAGIACGVQLYRMQRARAGTGGVLAPGTFAVVLGCVLGAAIGNKLVFWIEWPHLWAAHGGQFKLWMSGQSIVGGLLGGLLGVEAAKALTGQRQSTGDLFILPLMVGTVVGRIGCYLAGLRDGTYGDPTALPWGVDFGDGIARHPTQLYDMAFVLAWGALLLSQRRHWARSPGLAFKCYLAGYLLWRFLVDGIKPVPYAYFGLFSGIQLVCLLALSLYLPLLYRQARAVPVTQ